MHLQLLAQNANEMNAWWERLVSYFGIPGALCLAIVFCFYKGWLRPGREIVTMSDSYEKRLKEKDDAYDALKKESEQRLEFMRQSNEKYLNMLLRQQDINERAVQAAGRAAEKLPQPATGA
jgi:hypothetical protein